MSSCSHLGTVNVTELPGSVDGCVDCLATGSTWVHLRICLHCGHVGCCDSSPGRHARAHARERRHPIARLGAGPSLLRPKVVRYATVSAAAA